MRSIKRLVCQNLGVTLVLALTAAPGILAQVQIEDRTDHGIVPTRSRPLPWVGERSREYRIDPVSDSTLTEYVTRLTEFRTRRSCTDSNRVAGEWIYDTFQQFGFAEVYFDSFPYPLGPCDVQRNVAAVKPGTLFSDKVLVIGGHYDSITNPESGCDPDTLAPGADDNASGTAVVLETARILAEEETDLTLIFLAIGSEELGGFGSYHFAEEAFDAGLDIRTMFNADMVANENDDTWRVEVNVDSASIPYGELMIGIGVAQTDLAPFLTTPIAPISDHYSFYLFGYRSILIHEDDFSPHWHECTDTVDNLHIPYLTEVAEMVVQTVYYSANMPDLPSGFRVSNTGDGESLYLRWEPNTDPDLYAYRIHYGIQPGIYDSVKTVSSTEDTLRNLIDGTTYYMALSAIDIEEYESPLTEEVEILVSSLPYPPTGITSTSLDSAIILEWKMDPGSPPFDGYNIYRWELDGDPDTVLLDYVPDSTTTFHDGAAERHILYGYYVTSIDDQVPPEESPPSDVVYGRLATRDRGILLVDNTLDGFGGPFMPTDEEVDRYYSDLFRNYDVQASWDIIDSVASGRVIMDYDLGIYSSVLWHSDIRGSRSELSDTTAMQKYLDVGGNLWLSGWQLLAFIRGASESYYVFGNQGFVGEYVGIDSAKTTSTADQDFVGIRSLVAGFPTLFIDSNKVAPIGALFNTEVLLPPFEEADSLYGYISSDSAGSEYHGMPVAVTHITSDYVLVMTDFPLYFMNQDGATLLVDAVMEMFGEPLSVGEGVGMNLPKVYSLSQNYPNPFNPSTTIAFEIPGNPEAHPITRLTIYDVRGRRVRNLIDSSFEPGRYEVNWDGRDDRGQSVASGIYLYTLKAGGETLTRKMTVLK